MEAFGTYLLKSTVWITGFTLIYFLFLRNERFFFLNRIFLMAGILFSLLFPLITLHYQVVLPVTSSVTSTGLQMMGLAEEKSAYSIQDFLLMLYLIGVIYLVFKITQQTTSVFRVIKNSKPHHFKQVKLIRTTEYPASFSFFSYVFVNPSINDTETKEILKHEREHIRQNHWIDLLLFEILSILQWYNPFIWLYGRFIRQNHEYLADQRALELSDSPAIYRAALLNQMFGVPVISLANSFNYSLNTKRFNMMKNKFYSPVRKLRLLLVLPFIATVFYAFATPEYIFPENLTSGLTSTVEKETKTITGKVVSGENIALAGATVVVRGSTTGTSTDKQGKFKLDVSDDATLIFSFIGFKSAVKPAKNQSNMLVKMERDTVNIRLKQSDESGIEKGITVVGYGKKPENSESKMVQTDAGGLNYTADKITVTSAKDANGDKIIVNGDQIRLTSKNGSNGKSPLYVVDHVIMDPKAIEKLNPNDIASISILKGEKSILAYGEKAKDGVIIIVTKAAEAKKLGKTENAKSEVFTVVEEMPEYPGGQNELIKFITSNVKYPAKAHEKNIQGAVLVSFIVNKTGKIEDVKVVRSVDPLLDAEATRVVSLMPEWKPGKQKGEAVSVSYTVPISFKLDNTPANPPLFVLDGVVMEKFDMNTISPEGIEMVNVLKGEAAIAKYGDKAKYGAIEITSKKSGIVYQKVDEVPVYPGGQDAMMKYIAYNVKYPVQASKDNIQGEVIVKFIISKTGKIEQAKVQRSVHALLDEEALRVINSMPEWKPGKFKGETVSTSFMLPIKFKLQ